MQVTNILRDVGEDLHGLGRVYLPEDVLARHGIDRNDLDGRRARDPAYAALCEELMALAEELYAQAHAGIASLAWPQRAAVRAAATMYREILNEVRAAGYDNLTRRAGVPLPRKLLAVVGGYGSRRARLIAARAPGRG
jgi:phytoene synthase